MLWDIVLKFRNGNVPAKEWLELWGFLYGEICKNRKLYNSYEGGVYEWKIDNDEDAATLGMEKIRNGALDKFIEEHLDCDELQRDKELKAYMYRIVFRDDLNQKMAADEIDRKSQSKDEASGENDSQLTLEQKNEELVLTPFFWTQFNNIS